MMTDEVTSLQIKSKYQKGESRPTSLVTVSLYPIHTQSTVTLAVQASKASETLTGVYKFQFMQYRYIQMFVCYNIAHAPFT